MVCQRSDGGDQFLVVEMPDSFRSIPEVLASEMMEAASLRGGQVQATNGPWDRWFVEPSGSGVRSRAPLGLPASGCFFCALSLRGSPAESPVRRPSEDAMKVICDRDTDTFSIILGDGKIMQSDEPRPGLILDYDRAGRLVSLELLDASEQVKAPRSIEFALAAGEG
jgi:hypothetical protein